MAAELQVISKTYDLILWTLNHTSRFPRSHRYSLGSRIEQRLFGLMDDLVEAKYTRDKAEVLRRASLALEQLRIHLRMAIDLRLMPIHSHRHGIVLIDDIGRQLGGWRRGSVKTRN